LQVYVAVALYVVPVMVNEPFAVSGGEPQSTTVQAGVIPLQVPSAWQVRVFAPVME
jgi:hypothetical protein